MRLYFDDIVIKCKLLINKGFIDLSIQGITLITGKNGCGKTLLLKNAFLNKENSFFPMVYIDQNNDSVLINKTVLHNISMSNNEERNKNIKSILVEMGFEYLLSRFTSKISGGEKRLVNLLRGFFSDKKILLMDEPTNDLDNDTVKKVLSLIKRFSATKSIIAISHDDRLWKIADTIYTIKNHMLSLEKKFPDDKIIGSKKVVSSGNDKQFISTLFRYNFVSLLFTLIFVVISVFQITSYKEEDKTIPPQIKENQINLYSSLSISLDNRLFDGVYPVETVDLIHEKNPINQLSTLERINNDLKKRRPISFDLEIDDDECYIAYPFEFYDTIEKKTYFTMDLVLKTYYDTNWDVSSVDTQELFELPYEPTYTENPKIYSISKEQFISCANLLKDMKSPNGQGYEIVCSIVVLNEGFMFEDFYQSSAFKKLSENRSSLICNNDVINIIKKALELKGLLNRLITLLLVGIAILLVDSLFAILVMNMEKNRIFILKNYAYSCNDVKLSMIKQLNNRYPKLLLFFGFTIFSLLIYMKQPYSLANCVFILSCAVFMATNYWCNNKITESIVERYYRWWAR